MFATYRELEEYFYFRLSSYYRKGGSAFAPGTAKMLRMLEELGNPHKQTERIIHFAGTNGKGSTLAILDTLLQSAGFKTAAYTSPHIFYLGERIKISGKCISKKDILLLARRVYPRVESFSPTFFELITLLAFVWFAENNPDFVLLETGLGGRLDATNVVNSEIAVLTSVSYDHQKFLGNTLQEIAKEKAGIIRENSKVVVAKNTEEVLNVFKETAQEKKSAFYYAPDFFRIQKNNDRFLVSEGEKHWEFVSDLQAEYQAGNFETAFTVFKMLGFSPVFYKENLREIMKKTGISGRWQLLSQTPLLVLDAAHNREGLEKVLQEFLGKINAPPMFLLAFVKDKNIKELLSLFPEDGYFFFISPEYERMVSLEKFREIASAKGKKSFFVETPEEFLRFWKEKKLPALITGSFYHLSETLKAFNKLQL